MGLVDRRPVFPSVLGTWYLVLVVCRNLAMGFWVPLQQYLGFDVGYGWWTPEASKAEPLMDAKVRHEDPKKGLHDVRSFIGACNF